MSILEAAILCILSAFTGALFGALIVKNSMIGDATDDSYMRDGRVWQFRADGTLESGQLLWRGECLIELEMKPE